MWEINNTYKRQTGFFPNYYLGVRKAFLNLTRSPEAEKLTSLAHVGTSEHPRGVKHRERMFAARDKGVVSST